MRQPMRATLLLLSTTMIGCASKGVIPVVSGGEVAIVRTGALDLKQGMRKL